MLLEADEPEGVGTGMAQIGKRYLCGECGTEVLVTKAGEGQLECCGAAMGQVRPKTTASAD